MLIRSRRYPELRVISVGVKFRDGEAEVSDEAAVSHLRGLAHLGVEVPPGEPKSVPVKRKPGRPRKSD